MSRLLLAFAVGLLVLAGQPTPASAQETCPAGNLLAGRKPLVSAHANNTLRMTDGEAPAEGGDWNTDATSVLPTAAAEIVWDLGAEWPIRALYLQGDNNDEYPIAISRDRNTWAPLWVAGPVAGSGMRARTIDTLEATGRYLKLTAQGGDGSFSVGEVQAYCQKPAVWPPVVKERKGKVSNPGRERERRLAVWKIGVGLAGLFVFLLLALPREGEAAKKALDTTWGILLILGVLLQIQESSFFSGTVDDTTRFKDFAPGLLMAAGLTFALRRSLDYGITWGWPAALLLAGLGTVGWAAWVVHVGGVFTAMSKVALVAAVVAVGLVAWAKVTKRSVPLWAERAALILVATAGASAWPNFWTFHGGRGVHMHDTFHYYMGSKYFGENRYTHLYHCGAWAEVDEGNRKLVEKRKIRNLTTNHLGQAQEVLDAPEYCRKAFTPERWAEFRADMKFFRSQMGLEGWEKIYKDHGYNASPVWNLMGNVLASSSPASLPQVENLALLDAFFYATTFLAIGWAFGLRAMALALLIWGVGYPWAYFWTGGAFGRVAWLWGASLGVCFLKKGYPFLGGAALMVGLLDRVFPGALFGGLALKILYELYKTRRISPTHWRVVGGSLAAAAVLVPLSLTTAGTIGVYKEFWDNSQKHVETPLTNHMGLPTLMAYHPDYISRKTKDDRLEDPFQVWKEKRREMQKDRRIPFALIVVGMFGLVLVFGRYEKEDWQVTAASVLFILCLFEMTCYYYTFMILLAPLALRHLRHTIALIVMAVMTQLIQLNIGFYDMQYTWETLVVLGTTLYLLVDLIREGRAREREALRAAAPVPKPSLEKAPVTGAGSPAVS